jgi:hypothetical protein
MLMNDISHYHKCYDFLLEHRTFRTYVVVTRWCKFNVRICTNVWSTCDPKNVKHAHTSQLTFTHTETNIRGK